MCVLSGAGVPPEQWTWVTKICLDENANESRSQSSVILQARGRSVEGERYTSHIHFPRLIEARLALSESLSKSISRNNGRRLVKELRDPARAPGTGTAPVQRSVRTASASKNGLLKNVTVLSGLKLKES